ncbi:MAG: hypothetical protein WCC39_12055, partial [Telluria sp.]
MKKLATFATDIRVNTLLACSAAVLLSACGGGMNDAGNGLQSQTAATVSSSSDQTAANTAATTPNAADAAPAQAQATDAAPASGFELSGYDGVPASTGAA